MGYWGGLDEVGQIFANKDEVRAGYRGAKLWDVPTYYIDDLLNSMMTRVAHEMDRPVLVGDPCDRPSKHA